VRSRVYVTVRRPSVCLSVRLSVRFISALQQRAAGLLLRARLAADIDIDRLLHGTQQQLRRSTARGSNAGSATFAANVGS